MKDMKIARWIVRGSIILIMILTVLEMPAPIGFETRPQNDVSIFWLAFFLLIVFTEITAISLIFKFPRIAAAIGICAGVFNILQVLADQFHLMQPETAPLYYTMLEYAVALTSMVLIYFSSKILIQKR